MKQIYSLILLLFFCISCHAQVNENNVDSKKTNQGPSEKELAKYMEELRSYIAAGIDPYFVETKDTFSFNGPRCIVRDLLQDKKGNYWFATWHGIMGYDGKKFTNYTLKDKLIHFHVTACYEDKKGNLWFATARGGLYQYDGKAFKLFTKKDGLADSSVICFAEDKTGNIWFGTERGLSRYDYKTITNFTTKDGLYSNNISSLMVDSKGKLWVGCSMTRYMANDGGISCYDPAVNKDKVTFTPFKNKDGLSFKSVASILEDKTGNVWIGRMDGLSKYDGKTFTEMFDENLSYYIIEDKAGNIWLTHAEAPGGSHPKTPNQILYRYDGKTFTKVLEKYEQGDFQIFGKIQDKDGNIWFGTMQGPCKYDGKSFTYFAVN